MVDFNIVKYNMGTATLSQVDELLKMYTENSLFNPLEAATLNQRYKELTGKDHPNFLKIQPLVLDKKLAMPSISVNGEVSIYERLKNNLEGKEPGVEIIPDCRNNFIQDYESIKFNLFSGSLEAVDNILNHYGTNSVLINGILVNFRISPSVANNLNQRYVKLTGKDHPNYLKQRSGEVKEKNYIITNNYINKTNLRNDSITISDHNHVLYRRNFASQDLNEITKRDLDDLHEYMNLFASDPVMIDGISHVPFNDPITFVRLNEKYRELRGFNHPMLLDKVPKVIKNLNLDRDRLIAKGIHDENYFAKLDDISAYIKKEKDKETLLELRSQLTGSMNVSRFRRGFSSILLISIITAILCLFILIGGIVVVLN